MSDDERAGPRPVGRLAPSPSGRLHLGHARTFALAWAHVRARQGSLVLRMEDLDGSRCRPELVDGVLRDLEWLGLTWDGPVVYQSQRTVALRQAASQLLELGAAYPCVCTRADIELSIGAPHRGGHELRYPGTCRGRFKTLEEASRINGAVALRFEADASRVRFDDAIAGPQSLDVAGTVGDFVVQNRQGIAAYQLAAVVDDAAQGVNEVFRGDDLIESTARQILVQRALDLPEPRFLHVPLVVDESGRRLAKRADDLSLASLRRLGVDPRAVISWVGRSAGFEVPERASAHDLSVVFELSRLSRCAATLSRADMDELVMAR